MGPIKKYWERVGPTNTEPFALTGRTGVDAAAHLALRADFVQPVDLERIPDTAKLVVRVLDRNFEAAGMDAVVMAEADLIEVARHTDDGTARVGFEFYPLYAINVWIEWTADDCYDADGVLAIGEDNWGVTTIHPDFAAYPYPA